MLYVLASDILAPLGQAAAIILSIYTFISILVGLVFALLFMYAFTWVQEKTELVKKLRPTVDSLNTAIDAGSSETLPALVEQGNQVAQAVQKVQSVQVAQKVKDVQRQVNTIEKTIDQDTDRIASAVIEFHARTVMVQSMLKAFFLPGLAKQKPRAAILPQAALDSLTAESSGVAIAIPGPLDSSIDDRHLQPVAAGHSEPLASEGAERADDAPGR